VNTSAREIVEWMAEFVADGETTLEQRDGPRALAIAQEIEGALMSAMEGKLANVMLWEQFLLAPREVDEAVTCSENAPAPVSGALALLSFAVNRVHCNSVVQSLTEADPVLREWLEASLVRYRQASTK
jgi:hypothetical protein